MKILTSITALLLGLSSLSALAGTYTVKKGDTLYGIARKNGMSASSLTKLNGISSSGMIRPGQRLRISSTKSSKSSNKPKAPTSRSSSSSKRSSSTSRYAVQQGDTFYSLSRRYNISVSKIQSLNPSIRPDRLAPGMTLTMTGTAKSSPAPKKNAPKVAAKSSSSKKTASKPKSSPKPKAPAIAMSPIPKEEVPVSAPSPVREPAYTPPAYTPPAYTPPAANLEVSAATKSTAIMQLAPKVSSSPYIEPDIDLEAANKPEGDMISENGEPESISTVLIKEEVSYSAFADRYGSSTTQLNELNGLSLKPSTTLAKGSELYVPGTR